MWGQDDGGEFMLKGQIKRSGKVLLNKAYTNSKSSTRCKGYIKAFTVKGKWKSSPSTSQQNEEFLIDFNVVKKYGNDDHSLGMINMDEQLSGIYYSRHKGWGVVTGRGSEKEQKWMTILYATGDIVDYEAKYDEEKLVLGDSKELYVQ